MELYFAPNSRAVRSAWLLYELGIDFTLHRFEGLNDPGMRSPEFKALNPMGRIPVLIDEGRPVTESTAIAQYLVARHGGGRFAPDAASPEFADYLQWLHYGEGMIMGPMNNFVVETIILKPERRSAEHAERALKLMTRAVAAVDQHMNGRDWLAGDFSAADTITGHACLMCERLGVDMGDMPHLRGYIERLKARPALQKALAL